MQTRSFFLLIVGLIGFAAAVPLQDRQAASFNGSNSIIDYDVPNTNIALKITLNGYIPSPLILGKFLEATAAEASRNTQLKGHDYPLADDDKDPWVVDRAQHGYKLQFVAKSIFAPDHALTWDETLHTLDGLYTFLKQKPDVLTQSAEIHRRDTGQSLGTATVSMSESEKPNFVQVAGTSNIPTAS